MNKTKIDWCDSTWNPVTGCLHGCEYCYARRIADRFEGTDSEIFNEEYRLYAKHELDKPLMLNGRKAPYPYGFAPTFHRYRLNDYIGKKGRNIFVCSMADLFGDWVPDNWIEEVFAACDKAPQHNYLFLTKNPKRYVELQDAEKLIEKENMWYGASITDEESLKRVEDALGNIKCSTKTFLSIEPILEDISSAETWNDFVKSKYMDWVIIGAETGKRKNKISPDKAWIRSIYFDCYENWEQIPIFMKSSLADIWVEPLIQEFPKGLRT